jgi:hypothetical protein
MSEPDLDTLLREAALPDEGAARERGWRVVSAAFAERAPRRAPRVPRPVALAVAAGAAAVTVAVTPPGEAIGDWVRAVVEPAPKPRHVQRVLGPLPGGTRLLAVSPAGAWVVQRDGTRRRLGAYDAAAFSPHGLFVAVTRGRVLAAVDLRGRVHWTLTRPAPASVPSWSPDGFRIAYRSGDELRVVYGDGGRDHVLARRTAAVTPAWRPGVSRHALAFVDARGRVVLRDADTALTLWRARRRGGVRELAWSPDGRRLLVVTTTSVHVLAAGGRADVVVPTPAGTRTRRVAWLPGGRRFAVLRSTPRGSEVLLARLPRTAGTVGWRERRVLALPSRLTDVLASPDGRWLLLTAPDSGQWLLLRTTADGGLAVLDDVGRQFEPGGPGPAALPRPVGWIR